jgi:hypothetical protein
MMYTVLHRPVHRLPAYKPVPIWSGKRYRYLYRYLYLHRCCIDAKFPHQTVRLSPYPLNRLGQGLFSGTQDLEIPFYQLN